MKCIPTTKAEGHVLCHDHTQIIHGGKKGPAFRKGHVVTKEDIPVLLSMGKDSLYVWEQDDSVLHENDAAEVLRDISMGKGLHATEPSEGKIDLIADMDGLLTTRSDALRAVNSLGQMMIATRRGGFTVRKGDRVAGMRIIPLVIEKEKMEHARQSAGIAPIVNVLPFRTIRYGIVATGNEIFYGRIRDTFSDVVRQKLDEYGAQQCWHITLPDNHEQITKAIRDMLEHGADMVLCTGGMSVDPDDRTPLAIRNTGAQVVTYGAPALPGAMLMLAYADGGRPIVGLPGCVMHSRRTVLDLVLPRLVAGVPVTREDIVSFGEGGLCLQCDECTFPNCSFGR